MVHLSQQNGPCLVNLVLGSQSHFLTDLIFQNPKSISIFCSVRQQPAEKSQSQSTRVTRRSARLRKTEKTDKHDNIDSEDSSEKTDSDEEEPMVNGHELENDSSSPEDDTPLIHLKDDSPPPKVPKTLGMVLGPRAEELKETEPKIRPEVKLKKSEDNDRVEEMKIEKPKTENHKTKPENQKRKSPSPTNETVQNGDEKRTDANSNQEKQVSTLKPYPNLARQKSCPKRLLKCYSFSSLNIRPR